MNLTYEQKYHLSEEAHWWLGGHWDTIRKLIRSPRRPVTTNFPEIDCSGRLLQQVLLADDYTQLPGSDISENTIALTHSRDRANVSVMNGSRLSFANHSFYLLLASSVLKHLADAAAGRARVVPWPAAGHCR